MDMKYTGLTDRNRKPIADGAIGTLKVLDGAKSEDIECKVERDDTYHIWKIVNTRGDRYGIWNLRYFSSRFTLNEE